MKLTKKEAIDISIELWRWLAETGANSKSLWPGWKKYDRIHNDCPLCEYALFQREGNRIGIHASCIGCPYAAIFEHCLKTTSPYRRWIGAYDKNERSHEAHLFVEQLEELRRTA